VRPRHHVVNIDNGVGAAVAAVRIARMAVPALKGLHLHFDCASGIAGDMNARGPHRSRRSGRRDR